MRIATIALILAAAVAAMAFCLPLFAFDDDDDRLVLSQAAMMKTTTRHWSAVPPLQLHIVESRADLDATYPSVPDGRVEWRTLFGVSYGTTVIEDGQSATGWHHNRLFALVAAFIALEAGLLGLAAWRAWTST